MVKKTIVVAVACIGIALGSAAQARDDHRGQGPRGWQGQGHYDRHDHRRGGPDRDYRAGYRDGYRSAPRVVQRWAPPPRPPVAHWAPPPARWVRGDRLPHYHRGGYYVVHDWRARRLAPPGAGYQWVQVGPEYLLVAIASGVIASILLNQ
ncbi:hypothetical protein PIGHUM_01382 [Pigmentiphaga humi]|uniref:Nickel/cobalt homeostasis protein RcnB n=1 Tax=Pigmentiphaga humi TaxID=2478468 RepID=A0A3P4B0F6_9BURK|nr:RcnB family protein [Pigmentiphaga humi]VCU69321.1 hypothetical protein PIGHUM_01382 [Pigmentiphaga humi]